MSPLPLKKKKSPSSFNLRPYFPTSLFLAKSQQTFFIKHSLQRNYVLVCVCTREFGMKQLLHTCLHVSAIIVYIRL